MQFEIMKQAIPEECLRAFLNKNTRYDARHFNDLRQFSYTSNALESFPHSAIGSLGYNKVILVLQEQSADPPQTQSQSQGASQINLSLSIENNSIEEKTIDYSLYSFVNKLISGNLTRRSGKDDGNSQGYALYISIEGQDGNIYDTIAISLINFLGLEGGIDFTFKNPFITRTYCYVNDILLSDPLEDEVQLSSFYFTVIKFKSGEVYLHKITGGFIKWEIITQAANALTFNNK